MDSVEREKRIELYKKLYDDFSKLGLRIEKVIAKYMNEYECLDTSIEKEEFMLETGNLHNDIYSLLLWIKLQINATSFQIENPCIGGISVGFPKENF